MTYAEIQAVYCKLYGTTVKTCWIAEVKRKYGKTTRRAWNSGTGGGAPPCPEDVFRRLEKVMKETGDI